MGSSGLIEVCLTHKRWAPCYTGTQRYDSGNRVCKITDHPASVEWTRSFHNGEIDQPTYFRFLDTMLKNDRGGLAIREIDLGAILT